MFVLKKCKQSDDVLIVNASEGFEQGKRQNRLLPEHIGRIVAVYRERRAEEPFSWRVPMEEVEANGFNLHISRYVTTAQAVGTGVGGGGAGWGFGPKILAGG